MLHTLWSFAAKTCGEVVKEPLSTNTHNLMQFKKRNMLTNIIETIIVGAVTYRLIVERYGL